MNAQQIIDQSKLLIGPNITVDDAVWLACVNWIYNDFYNAIIALQKNYFYTSWTADVVNWTNQYSYLASSYGVFWQNKVEKIWIKYNTTDTYYRATEELDYDTLKADTSWYESYQPITEPFYIISDGNIRIFPTPTKDITAWIKFEGMKLLYDLTASSSETDILIPPNYHNILVQGTIYRVYKYLRMREDEQIEQIEYKSQLRESLNELTLRVSNPVFGIPTDNDNLA